VKLAHLKTDSMAVVGELKLDIGASAALFTLSSAGNLQSEGLSATALGGPGVIFMFSRAGSSDAVFCTLGAFSATSAASPLSCASHFRRENIKVFQTDADRNVDLGISLGNGYVPISLEAVAV